MKRTILIAAARPVVLDSLVPAIKLAGFNVTVVKSGLDALRRARMDRPELILLDAVLPDMDGASVADILCRLPSTAGIQTVILQFPTSTQTEILLELAHVLRLCPSPDGGGHFSREEPVPLIHST